MKVVDYVVDKLIEEGVTDAFGVPGGVVLDLMYAFDARREQIAPHLNYHEQSAGFAACGYAQASGHLGVAYATRGPGFTNLMTAIAEAYCDSLPVLFITGHAAPPPHNMRVMADQELDTVAMVANVTKYARRIEEVADVAQTLQTACCVAMDGRKGPVLLDFASSIWQKEICSAPATDEQSATEYMDTQQACETIVAELSRALRPVILLGDGVHQAKAEQLVSALADTMQIPVLSSRVAHDIVCGSAWYFGYIGSHGIRTANFILSKADLILCLGNRLNFPMRSESFRTIPEHARILRVEIDGQEFSRRLPNAVDIHADLRTLVELLLQRTYPTRDEWMNVCRQLSETLQRTDVNSCVETVANLLQQTDSETVVVSDVGNLEFWLSRAAVLSKWQGRILYSNSFGSLGSALGRAIGAYYAMRTPILCFVGDQGLQMNVQELQYIAQHRMPVTIVLLNNRTSGMIKDKEERAYAGRLLHTTQESGYQTPSFQAIAAAYELEYSSFSSISKSCFPIQSAKPALWEISVDAALSLSPYLPKGAACQNLMPALDDSLYESLNNL